MFYSGGNNLILSDVFLILSNLGIGVEKVFYYICFCVSLFGISSLILVDYCVGCLLVFLLLIDV